MLKACADEKAEFRHDMLYLRAAVARFEACEGHVQRRIRRGLSRLRWADFGRSH